ncbi:hypothetical protein BJX63DRAFT_384745 [Aspergillus granulosus]|uniref:Uncharacterized protein n=1 Tax=Aspergillus granulosus TaxID=176169 RepID=A0ABR4HRM5_9EURO
MRRVYSCIKLACDVHHGVCNINVLTERFEEPEEQYFAKCQLKFNPQLGGISQILKPNEIGIIRRQKYNARRLTIPMLKFILHVVDTMVYF